MLNFTATTPRSTYTDDGRYLKELPKDYYATKTCRRDDRLHRGEPEGRQTALCLRLAPVRKLPVNFQLRAYWHAVRPDNGPDWQLRFQVQLLFPK